MLYMLKERTFSACKKEGKVPLLWQQDPLQA
jgi:hypothetical protein